MKKFLHPLLLVALLALVSAGAIMAQKKGGGQNANNKITPIGGNKIQAPKGQPQQKNQQQKSQQKPGNGKQEQAAPAPKISAADTMNSFRGKVAGRFMDLMDRGINEKVYMQFDKPYYSAGDTIWFKGYLVNAVTNVPKMPSNYIYVELLDHSSTLLQRMKIKADEWGFHNGIGLDPKMPAGDYVIRAYTQWMRNESDSFYFSRPVRVANPSSMDFYAGVTYKKIDDKKVAATMTIYKGPYPITGQQVLCKVKVGGKESDVYAKSDAKGSFSVPFNITTGRNSISIEVDTGDPEIYKASFRLPDYTTDFDLKFFPEGGPLLAATMQRTAFKAVGVNGLSVEVTGKVYNAQDEEVGAINSVHNGMGYISVMVPSAGERFYAVVRSNEGLEKRFDLPQAVETGYALKIMSLRDRIVCDVAFTPGAPADSLGIVAHAHGRILFAQDYVPGQPKLLSTAGLPAGIISFTLVHKRTLEPLSQRVAFIPELRKPSVAILPDKPSYGKRERAEVKLTLADASGAPVTGGSFAVSVTDMNTVKWDTLAGNINSYLLLTSDLKGYIEDPGEYFRDDSPERAAKLDLLMMTQGWTRFEMSELLAGTLKPYTFGHEESQMISGKVTGFFGGVVNGADLAIFAPKAGYIDRVPLDNKLYFHLTGLSFPEKTQFALQALTKGGVKRSLSLDVDPETFPGLNAPIPALRPSEAAEKLPEAFLNQSRKRYAYYYEDGMRVLDLATVTVTEKKQNSGLLFGVESSKTITAEQINEKYLGMTAMEMIRELYPRVARIHGFKAYIEDFPAEGDQLQQTYAEQIEKIDIVDGPDVLMLGLDNPDGVVVLIELKNGMNQGRVPLSSLVVVNPLGYKKPTDFYQPHYEVDSVRLKEKSIDARSTLLWEPRIKPAADGTASVWFYTADDPTTYQIILEGITEKGEICRAAATVQRK